MGWFFDQIKIGLKELLEAIFVRPTYDTPIATVPMNQNTPTPPANPDMLIPDWENFANARHNVRVLCDLEGLSVQQKNDLSSTVHCESNYNPKCVHPNIVNGKTVSTDYGICQINDFYHIGKGKDFPSIDFVLNNPEACIRWMCKQWLAGRDTLWVCRSKGLYQRYSA